MPQRAGSREVVRRFRGLQEIDRRYRGRDVVFQRGAIPTVTDLSISAPILNRSAFADHPVLHLYWLVAGATSLAMRETGASGGTLLHPLPLDSRNVAVPRPGEDTTFTLLATNAAGTAVRSVTFTVISDAAITEFRVRPASFWQAPEPWGGVIGSLELEWTVSGEPFPALRLTGAGDADFDSGAAGRSRRDHTDHATGRGSVRFSRQLAGAATVNYELAATGTGGTVTARTSYLWPGRPVRDDESGSG